MDVFTPRDHLIWDYRRDVTGFVRV